MGGKSSKKKSKGNKDGDKRGGNPTGGDDNLVSITNDIFIGSSKSSPAEDYIQMNFLGEGSFASVYKVKNRYTGEPRAMKIIKKSSTCSESADQEITNEINILKKMDHPNILKIFEFYSSKDSYSIVTELCYEGELFNEIVDKGPFNEKYSAYIMYQVLSAVNYCHNMNIVHRDLKPENILIESKDEITGFYHLKIIDFGTAKIYDKNKKEDKIIGSPFYIAPEVLKGEYNEKCDVWSAGVLLYAMLYGKFPFMEDNEGDDLKSITFKELWELSGKVCGYLYEHGIKRGDTVAIYVATEEKDKLIDETKKHLAIINEKFTEKLNSVANSFTEKVEALLKKMGLNADETITDRNFI